MPDDFIEPVLISDVYADGIAYVENLGNCIRIAYFTWARTGNGFKEKVIVAKIVRPLSSLLGSEELHRMIDAVPVTGMTDQDGKRSH